MNRKSAQQDEYVLELDGISKSFPGVKALDKVSLELRKGEILALVGENGAGKSTLINCITGVLKPDEGEIRIQGSAVHIRNPQASVDLGISVVHQERNLIPTFDVGENIFFEKICGKTHSLISRKWMHEHALPLLERVRLKIDPSASVEDLSSAQKQLIEIARALSLNASILLLDEPTASISIQEADMLLDIIQDLKKQGVSIIYVSHKLEEIFASADRVKVIRDGKSVGDAVPTDQLTRDRLIEKMVGSRELLQAFPLNEKIASEYVLEVDGITSRLNHNPASFRLKKGEILGWYGLVGAGRTELAREVIGIDPVTSGSMKIYGHEVTIGSYKEAVRKHGIYYISENRKEEGLFLMHSIATNISSVVLKKIKNALGLNSFRKERALAGEYAALVNVRMRSLA
jgi:ribose transport system ATP-binding protein